MVGLRERGTSLRTFLWVVAAIVVIAAAMSATVLLRGRGPLRASIRLVALGADGVFGSDVALAAPGDTAVEGFPLVLGVVNEGRRAGRPGALRLAVPAWVRLVDAEGDVLAAERTEGNPLAFVRLELANETVEPGALPLVPAGLERLRLHPVLSPIDCRLEWNGVPAFQSAPPWDAELLSRVSIYWAFDENGGAQAGLLNVRLPAPAVQPEPVRMEFGEPETFAGDAPWPAVGPLSGGSVDAVSCGEPESPLHLMVMAWRAEGGGHLIIVSHDRRARLLLFDLDGDARVDLEIQDTNADGVFETRRPVSYPIPAFLIPRG